MADLWRSDETPESIGQIVDASTGGLAKFLTPKSNGGVDVINNYTWTLTPKGTDNKGREETPRIILTEFRLLTSSFLNSAKYYITGAQQQVGSSGTAGVTNGYKGLFDFSNPTKFWYVFPYFNETANEVQSSWTTLDAVEKGLDAAGVVPGLREGAETILAALRTGYEANFPRVGVMDRPKIWEQSTPRSINIKFPLFNTKEYSDIKKNWELCYLLLYQNSFNKRDFVTAIPPVFYTVWAPGQFFTIAAYVSDLKIYNRGNIRHMDIGLESTRSVNVPDVFEIDMTLTDMVMPSQNMLSYIMENTQPVTVQDINK
jgi:hypothetical protein